MRTQPFLLTLLIAIGMPLHAAPPERGFISKQPARNWEQALITGNGKQGAMVYGVPNEETVILNHGRLYLPLHPPLPPPDTGPLLPEIRRRMAAGEFHQAADLVVPTADQAGYGGKRWTDPFISACDLRISLPAKGDPTAYQRSVDFTTGIASTEWADTRGRFSRRVFVSRADDVIAMSLTGPGKGTVDCQLRLATRPAAGQGGWDAERMFKSGIKDTTATAADGWLTYRASFRRNWPGSLQGYQVTARVITTGGTSVAAGDSIRITGADEVLVLARIEPLTDLNPASLPKTQAALAALPAGFTALLDRHVAIHGPLFRRVRLDLGGGADRALGTEELLEESAVGSLSPALLEKVFDAARYAVLSSSGDVFPNLQGIWNGTWSPPWSADFTLNGNVQCALAADLSGNLAECLLPFFRFLEEHLPEFRENARRLYGCRGIHVPSRASSHGLNNHFDATWPMTFWTAGAAWAGQFYHEFRMEVRRREQGGIMAFGLVQMGLSAAALRDAGMAYEIVDWLTNNFWNTNLVSTHNPNELFNTDICGGLPAVVLAMLVDSRPGHLDLLPALPKQWPRGSVEGVRCRGNLEVRSLRWTPERTEVTLRAGTAQTLTLTHPGREPQQVNLPAGKDVPLAIPRSP